MSLLSRFLDKTEFVSYEDFRQNFSLRIPENFNFTYDVIDVYAKEEPDRLALLWCDDHHPDLRFTFADLAKLTNRFANLFTAHGIGRGDSVMLVMKSRYEFWPAILALHKIGAIAIPATHMLKEHDLVYRIEKARLAAIVATPSDDLFEQIEAAKTATGNILKCVFSVVAEHPGWIFVDRELENLPETFADVPREQRNANDDTMLTYFTSGTSGLPKMVAHSFTYPLGHIITAAYWQCVQPNSLHYTVADTGWGKAVWGKLYGQWFAGATVFVYDYDRFDAENMLRKIQEHRITTFCAPPTVYRFLIKSDLSNYDLSSLKYAVTAGEPLNPEVYDRFLEKTGLKLHEGYGQTELVVTCAMWPWLEPRPGSMGLPSPGYVIDILDEDDKPVEIGEEGEVCVRIGEGYNPPGLFLEYHGDDEQTARAKRNGYYHTGDMAWRDEQGFLWFVGRADDVIKSSGYRIGPFEVESVLMQHPAVVECAITGAPDPLRGQVIKATIVLAKGYEPTEELKKEIQNFVKNNTAPYKYPRIVEFVAEMPKTISGKIRRSALREQHK